MYAVFIFTRCHPVKSRVLLAIAGCASVGMSIAVAYGLTVALGRSLNPVINVLPFILIGIGVDDMFVLVAALEAEGVEKQSVPVRMGKAMGAAGVSITITSLTDMIAFVLGVTSRLPALATFCAFAAVGITADFLLQISFFAGWMALDAYREKKTKPDCCPCCCAPTDAASGTCCCACTYNKFGCVKAVTQPKGNFCTVLLIGGLKAWIQRYYIPALRPKAVKAVVIFVFVACTGFMAWAASNLKQDFQFRWFVNDDAALQEAFDIQDAYFQSNGLPVNIVTPKGKPGAGDADGYFDYASIDGQKKLVALHEAVEASSWIEEDSANAWYPMLREWVYECGLEVTFDEGPMANQSCIKRDCVWPETFCFDADGTEVCRPYPSAGKKRYAYCTHKKNARDDGGNTMEDVDGDDIPGALEDKYLVLADGTRAADDADETKVYLPEAMFWAWLDQFLADSPFGGTFASEIVWVDNSTVRDEAMVALGVTATRIRANYIATDEAADQVASMVDLRASVASAGVGDAFPYMFMYLYYEQYAIIFVEAMQNLGLALLAVLIIVYLLVANFGLTLLVMLCVLMVDVNILGLMWLWGLTIDSVAIINLVLAIGLAVDYSVHVAHAFMQTPGTRQERTDHALLEMGTAVMHGAVSTFLAVLILSTSKSYIFRIFFKQFFGICVFGAAHGLLFLPVLLSLIGPSYSPVGKPATPTTPAAKADPNEVQTSTAASATVESSVSVSASASKKRVVATATHSSSEGIEVQKTPITPPDTVSAPPSPPFSARIGSPRVSPFDDDDSCAA